LEASHEEEKIKKQIAIELRSTDEGSAALLIQARKLASLLAEPDSLTKHEETLNLRLDKGVMKEKKDNELRDYATSILLRCARSPNSASWKRFNGLTPIESAWEDEQKKFTDAFLKPQKLLRSWEEALLELQPAQKGPVEESDLARKDGLKTNELDLWQLVHNIGGNKKAAQIRSTLYNAGKIAHPHIGAWVSNQKPWCPPLANPVGNWQNVYQLLVLGMFDSHYMPKHVELRQELKPIIEQMWYATSRKPFEKVLFAPERFNLRELPEGGSKLPWHMYVHLPARCALPRHVFCPAGNTDVLSACSDQDAIAPACPPTSTPQSDVEQLGGFLMDTLQPDGHLPACSDQDAVAPACPPTSTPQSDMMDVEKS
jgi:hypothetical protein